MSEDDYRFEDIVPYLTYVMDRAPQVKLHTRLSDAKNALLISLSGRVRGGQLWSHGDSGWDLMYDVPRGAPASEVPWYSEEQVEKLRRYERKYLSE